jgi:D-sedoheptulose 7-phosphate isomerase
MLETAGPAVELPERVAAAIRARTPPARRFFADNAGAIAEAARAIAQRLAAGGRIYAFGRGAYATDAQHVAVEFVHPVLVGKPALPASDLSQSFEAALPLLLEERDVVVAFGPPRGDPVVERALADARARSVYTVGMPARGADFALGETSDDEHVHQEFAEIVGHLLYESVHVFLEHRGGDHDVGASAFLYPFLGGDAPPGDLAADVTRSIEQKAATAEALRERVAAEESGAIAAAAETMARELAAGGRLVLFGNGGSGTDANDWFLDCVMPPAGLMPIAALSLSAEPATISAIANDVGREFIFARQLIAHIRPHDVAIALSTSGGSSNVMTALEEARKRGNATVALLGYDGGEILRRRLADHAIVVRSDEVPRVQEAQATIYHTLRVAVDWLLRDGA